MIIDPVGTMRPVLTSVLGDLGYRNVKGETSMKEALSSLQTGSFSWIVTYLSIREDISGMHLLRLCINNEELKETRISMFFDEAEFDYIPLAFSFGLLSWHLSPPTPKSLKQEIKDILTNLKQNEGDDTIVAHTSLRHHMMEAKKYSDLITLDLTFTQYDPNNAQYQLNMAESQYLTGDTASAGATLYQTKLSHPELTTRCDQLADEYLGRKLTDADQGGEPKIFLIIDHDESASKATETQLRKLKPSHIEIVEDGQAGIDYIKENQEDIDLIVTEWRIRKLPGPAFVQRVRSEISQTLPIIIHSSLIKKNDANLLKEVGVSTVIQKPIVEADFISTVLMELRQSANPSEVDTLSRKIFQLIKAGNIEQASTLAGRLFALKEVTEANCLPIQAEFLFHEKQYEEAKAKAMESIKISGPDVTNLNTLGKSCMALGEFESAMKCFDKAKAMSPDNLERLCMMANIEYDQEDKGKADELMEQASKIDKDAESVVRTKVDIMTKEGDTAGAKEILGSMDNVSNMISFWNNQAIAYARNDRLDQAYKTYERALESLPKSEEDLKTLVSYNFGLAYVRAGEYKRAKALLEQAAEEPMHRIYNKANSLLDRVEEAIHEGTKVVINKNAEVKHSSALEDQLEFFNSSDGSEPGKYTLYGIYSFGGTLPSEAKGLMSELPELDFSKKPKSDAA